MWRRTRNVGSVCSVLFVSHDMPLFFPFLLVLIPVNYCHLCLNQAAQLSLCVHLFVTHILSTAPSEPPFWSSGSLTVRAHGDFWPPALLCLKSWLKVQSKVASRKSLCVGSLTLVLFDSNEEFTAMCNVWF